MSERYIIPGKYQDLLCAISTWCRKNEYSKLTDDSKFDAAAEHFLAMSKKTLTDEAPELSVRWDWIYYLKQAVNLILSDWKPEYEPYRKDIEELHGLIETYHSKEKPQINSKLYSFDK